MKTYRTTAIRKMSIYGFDAVNNGHNIYALLELDITGLRKHLRERRAEGEGGSLFSFFLKAIALCLQEFPEFNSMINHRKTTEFESVDISIPIEITRDGSVENKQLLIKNVPSKTIKEINDEIENSKNTIDEQRGYILSRPIQILMNHIPRKLAVLLIKTVMRNHKKVMELSGSVFVTSVSMFSSIPGFIIPFIGGPKACSFAIGSTIRKPVVVRNEILIREMINITTVFNHDIIDGAPAARFINAFRRYIESSYTSLG